MDRYTVKQIMTHTLLNMASVSMKINKVSFCFECYCRCLLSLFTLNSFVIM